MFSSKRSFIPKAHTMRKMCAAGASLMALVLVLLPAGAAMADSFTERPWGLDSAAGRCVVCHSLEKNGPFRVAPNLWNIVGAEKARERAWFAYSPGLIEMGGTWTREDLDRYLEDAAAFAPGSTKSIRVPNPDERRQIIDFLATLTD
jgi:cytochrome c2